VLHVPVTIMINQGTDSLSRGICVNGLNVDFKSFTVEVFLPDLPIFSLTKWALNQIRILEEYAPFFNVEMDNGH
jgi:hypothetical protein